MNTETQHAGLMVRHMPQECASGAGMALARRDSERDECMELLEHLAGRLREKKSRGTDEACIFLLEHLATRMLERNWSAATN